MKKKIKTDELQIGMYIEQLDRPWIETPYLLQGILISSEEDISKLSLYCNEVFVTIPELPICTTERKIQVTNEQDRPASIPEYDGRKSSFHGQHDYLSMQSTKNELLIAEKLKTKSILLMNQIRTKIDQNLELDANIAKELVGHIADSVIRNPDAMILINEQDDLQFDRAITLATYMIAFGRHLCLPPKELTIMGLGGLLLDIGLLQKKKHTEGAALNNHDLYLEHVQQGEEILSKIEGMPIEVLQITAQHHECEDGTGYPQGLSANKIVPYAQMAHIVDLYMGLIFKPIDSLVLTTTPFEALKMLWDLTGRQLNITLVKQFAYCIGLCPVGSLVELNTGEVGIVLSHNRVKRLSPSIMIVLDKNKNPYETPWPIDLSTSPLSSQGTVYEIKNELQRGAYGIDPKKYYL